MQHSPGIPHWKYGMESKLSISNSTHHWKSTLAWNVKCGVEKQFSIPHTWNCNTYVHTYSSLENAKLEHCGELSGIRICIFCCKVRVDWKWKIVERKVVALLFIYTVGRLIHGQKLLLLVLPLVLLGEGGSCVNILITLNVTLTSLRIPPWSN